MTPAPTPSSPGSPRRSEALTFVARSPEDLLAMVPVTLGFVPHDSVAMLTFGARHPFHARVDLPTRAEDLPELVEVLLRPARSHGVRRVVLVLYTDDVAAADRAWRALRLGCGKAGIQVLDVMRADGARWFPLLDRDRAGADAGFAYDVSAHPFLVESILQGRVTHASREDLAAILRPLPTGVAAATAALAAHPDPWTRETPPPTATILSEGAWIEALVARHVADGTSPTDAEVARLLHALPLRRLRSAAWSLITREDGAGHVALWTDVLRRTPAGLAASPAALLAWSAWLVGHGALAWCALDVATAHDPDDPMSLQLAHFLEHAVSPAEWSDGFDWRHGLAPPAA